PGWSARLISELNAAGQHAKELAGPLPPPQNKLQSASGAWGNWQSPWDLSLVNSGGLPWLSAAPGSKPNHPFGGRYASGGGRWFIRSYIEPSPQSKRASAPKKIVPGSRVERSVLDRFLSTNHAVREIVRRAGAHNVNRIRFKNPFIPVLRFTIGTGLQIICS